MKPIIVALIILAAATAQATPGAKITWTASTERDLAGYRIYRGDSGTTYTIIADLQTSPTVQARYIEPGDTLRLDTKKRVVGLNDMDLQPVHWYYYVVIAYDRAGNVSLPSRAATWIPAPIKQPANLQVEAMP